MTIWAIVPVKSLQQTKGRLTAVLTPTQRAQLTCRLLRQTINSLHAVPQINTILVVTQDKTIAQLAESQQAIVIAEQSNEGLIEAVTLGKQFAANHRAQYLLILPSDLPFLSAANIETFISNTNTNRKDEILICSDQQQQGTNALFMPATRPFQFHYGPNSYQRHLAEAQRQQIIIRTINIPSLQFDLDTEADWHQYQLNLANYRRNKEIRTQICPE